MTTRQAGVVDTESHRLGDGFNHWSYELVFHLCEKQRRHSLLDVPKESLRIRRTSRRVQTRVNNGTNFRHAVEFSRSGRTPSRSFRTGRGQPTLRYSVGFARSNLPQAPPASHLVAAHGLTVARRAWGISDRIRPNQAPIVAGGSGGSVRRTGRRLASRGDGRQVATPTACRPAFAGVTQRQQTPCPAGQTGANPVIRATTGQSALATRLATRRFPEASTCPISSDRGRS
jgi:hypothetical protein